MLSYQHSFHAGNHADVVKHLTLLAVLNRLTQKSKPLFYLDTHAGAGIYSLLDEKTQLNSEFEMGVAKLLENNHLWDKQEDIPEYIGIYLNAVKEAITNSTYPGSPLIASLMLRHNDVAHAVELNTQASKTLQSTLRSSTLRVHCRDAFEALNAFMPPKPNRGMVLIDPPYEQASEYGSVTNAIRAALKKWSNGCFVVWYPLLSPDRLDRKTGQVVANPKSGLSEKMLHEFANMPIKSAVKIELCPTVADVNVGMYGSGICIINPPWQLDQDLQALVVLLRGALTTDGNDLSKCQWIKTEE